MAATAVMGGLAAGLAVQGLFATVAVGVSHWGMALVGGFVAICGGAVQWYVIRKRCQGKGKDSE